MEVLSIQQHARDTLSRLRMKKRNVSWVLNHMGWGNLLEAGAAYGMAMVGVWWCKGWGLHRGYSLVGAGQRLQFGGLHRDCVGCTEVWLVVDDCIGATGCLLCKAAQGLALGCVGVGWLFWALCAQRLRRGWGWWLLGLGFKLL
ncbi:hypothetical protein Acr_05g0010620 [Actinidia rufa]|uniref:Uncharacterized protein n=1 Tax=Actinidia rufa TaxID=165716 RepID=A0A7J0ELS8_9ERIC|nr:hypothetical protein Acr_05g0010620 [Actinidia rufa]